MKEKYFDTWDDFLEFANALLNDADYRGKSGHHDKPLFRGHADASWKLETSLERYIKNNPKGYYNDAKFLCKSYHDEMDIAVKTVNTVASVALRDDAYKEPSNARDIPENLSTMAWLRQNGFPSPLLDWSRSPYIASFFAYAEADLNRSNLVSIYTFIETITGSRLSTRQADSSYISSMPPWLKTDKKHFLQQSAYTMSRCEINEKYFYSSHEEALVNENPEDQEQMIFEKCILPANEKISVLRRLRRMNITRYSLFETTPALLATVADDLFTT